jgi:hypothetical protein
MLDYVNEVHPTHLVQYREINLGFSTNTKNVSSKLIFSLRIQ